MQQSLAPVLTFDHEPVAASAAYRPAAAIAIFAF